MRTQASQISCRNSYKFKLRAISLPLAVGLLTIVAFAMSSNAGDRSNVRSGKFVGLSDDFVLGDVGFDGLEEACVKGFNDRVRVCTSEEIIKAPRLKMPISDPGAWVYPTTVDATPDLANGGVDMFDFSLTGATSLTNFSCRIWTTQVNAAGDPATGLIVIGPKDFTLERCDEPRSVACCRAD